MLPSGWMWVKSRPGPLAHRDAQHLARAGRHRRRRAGARGGGRMTSTDRSASSSAATLLRAVGLVPQGPVTWGSRVPCDAPGVYVIETPELFAGAPLDRNAIIGWLARVPTLRVDGVRPTAEELSDRLAAFWIVGETVVYVGLAGTSVAKRVGQFYRTALGDPRPHAGGHWLKTLAILDRLHVWWAK